MGNSESSGLDVKLQDIFTGDGDRAVFWPPKRLNEYKPLFMETKQVVQEILSRMEKLWMENKVMIWHKQCDHLLERYREGVAMKVRVLDALYAAEGGPILSLDVYLVKFICSTLIRCMLEGEASLLFCSEKDNYTKAAFALSSPRPPSRMTFSRFGLVLRELDWTVDFIRCIGQQYVDGKRLSFDDWKWCAKSCRPVLIQDVLVTDEETLEADGRQQAQDQEAFLNAVNSKPHSSSSAFNLDNRGKLEAIWSQRLAITSLLSEPDSLADCFWIDNPDSFEYVDHLSNGAFKVVDKRKWLGEMVAVALSQGYPKQQLITEAGLLARVQHPNVVELLGCAFKEDVGEKSRSFLVTELMEQDLESLIRQQLRRNDGSETYQGPPFALAVAVDIALQIVEAMVHVRECKVIHRDLKPGNCLVSPEFRQDSLLGLDDVPMYYTVKLIDFGTSKLRGTEDSYFLTKAGTTSYMAPELSANKPYTWSADVWSFGMTCYKIFTGKDPIQKKISGKRPECPLRCSARLEELIENCCAKDPDARPTIQKVREDLWELRSYYAWGNNPVLLDMSGMHTIMIRVVLITTMNGLSMHSILVCISR
jgi:serine/threonine protein kinase